MAKQKTGKGELPKGKLSLLKDPRAYAELMPKLLFNEKRVLGLDLASSCGATFCDIIPGKPVDDRLIIGGQWDLSISTHDTQSIRYIRLKQFLNVANPDLIFYEEVKYTGQATPPGMQQTNLAAMVARAVSGAQVVHSLAAILVTWAEERNIPCEAVGIGTLKKYATGSGNAGKPEMIKACNEQMGTNFDPVTYQSTGADNIADSMFLCKMGVQYYSEGLA